MTLGEKLYKLRKSREMSQEELASKIVVSRQAISKWELDTEIPTTENIIQLSMLFGVFTDYLLNIELKRDMDILAVKANQRILHKTYRIQTISIVLISI